MDSDTECSVQIFKLDFSSSSQDLPVAGQPVNAPERFHRLSWNAFVVGTPEQEKYPVNPHTSMRLPAFTMSGKHLPWRRVSTCSTA